MRDGPMVFGSSGCLNLALAIKGQGGLRRSGERESRQVEIRGQQPPLQNRHNHSDNFVI